MYKHILIPTDGSETAGKAITAGIEFAREAKARVTLFTAMPEYQPPSESDVMSRSVESLADFNKRSQAAARQLLDASALQARAAGIQVDTDFTESDRPYEAIVDAAKRNGCDAIFIGSHGRKGLARLWHGSQTAEVLTHSAIPTLVFR
jgi:nucleotide-binding universal stress UspA family protein